MNKYLNEYKAYEDSFEEVVVGTKTITETRRDVTDIKSTPKFEDGVFKGFETKVVYGDPYDVTITKNIIEKRPPAGAVEPTPPTIPAANKGDVTITRTYNYKPDDVSIIDRALDRVLRYRSELGATQNKLEHAFENNNNKSENTQASESVIRDADMAKEMVHLSLQNILAQVGVSMMTQANQSQQSILSLLQ